jgi:polyferredoxin
VASRPIKKLVRRLLRDHSQLLRHSFQAAFLLLNICLRVLFYFWVRQFRRHCRTRRPMAHPAAMFLLLAFLSMAFFLRKALCSWLCPVGTISEYLWRAGRLESR